MKLAELVKNRKESIETETNAVIRLYRAVDLCEFAIKILVAHQLKMMVNYLPEDETKKEIVQNIQRTIQFHFQCPSLGHWASLLRDLQRLELYPERRINDQLKKVSISSNKIVEIRNRYAHGITPTHEQAEAEYHAILNHMEALLDFLGRNNLYEVITDIVATTPLFKSIREVYNRAKSRKDSKISCEFLDYFSGKRIVVFPEPDLNDYFKEHFNLTLSVSSFEILSLLHDYFKRDYWERKIQDAFTGNSKIFMHGVAGVGKTTLAARIAQINNSDFFMYSVAKRGELKAIYALHRLYQAYRLRIGGLPPLPEGIDLHGLRAYMQLMVQRIHDEPESEQTLFVIDGLDELPEEELLILTEELQIFRNIEIKLLFCSRNRSIVKTLQGALGLLEIISLEPLTENELLEWFKAHNEYIETPSPALIKAINTATEGNFLFLKSIPPLRDEQSYYKYLNEIPGSIQVLFEKIIDEMEEKHALVPDALAFFAVIPGGCSQKLVGRYFHLNRKDTKEVFKILAPYLKEIAGDLFILYHAKFVEYIGNSYAREVREIREALVGDISSYEGGYIPLKDIPTLFAESNDMAGLARWLEQKIVAIETILISANRFEWVQALAESFICIGKQEPFRLTRSSKLLEIFIDNNFQALLDWRIALSLKACLVKIAAFNERQTYPMLNLLIAAAYHLEGDFEKTLSILNDLKSCFSKIDSNYLRCYDYIGLTYGKLGKWDQALTAYTEVIETCQEDLNNGWVGYAYLNRGKLNQRMNNMRKAEEDIVRGIKIREAVVCDEHAIIKNLKDNASEVQAKLTLAMGYENLLKLYHQTDRLDEEDAKSLLYTLENLLESIFDQYPDEVKSFTFTARVLLLLAEIKTTHQTGLNIDYLLSLASECFLRKEDLINLDRLRQEFLNS
jgi:tetratricopeptide (TPR) repeat protein